MLERNDKLKWFVWTAHGKKQEGDNLGATGQPDEDEYDSSNFSKTFDEFFNKADAQARFEKKFFEKTCNKWIDREYFKEKPGKYVLQSKDKKQKILKEAFQVE